MLKSWQSKEEVKKGGGREGREGKLMKAVVISTK